LGSARLLIPDNAKISVIKAAFMILTSIAAELAARYGAALLAARPYRPRDIAKVEACAGIVERWLLGRLHHRIWHRLGELNAAIADLQRRLKDEWVCASSGARHAPGSMSWMRRCSSLCRLDPTSWRNARVGSIIMLQSRSVLLSALPPRARCGPNAGDGADR
jgi:hypothetical protein